jgi:hypothetical protein
MPFVGELKDRLWPLVQRWRLEQDRLLGGNCVVLLYHRVVDLEHDPQQLSVSPRRFDEQVGLLKERFRVLTVEEFEHHLLHRKRFPKNSILITFDDGYADNHVHARPILEKHGLQGLFFIASGYIGSGAIGAGCGKGRSEGELGFAARAGSVASALRAPPWITARTTVRYTG